MRPLSNITILDLTKLLPGPWCTMMLADLGADVIKIENPNSVGDPSRAAYPRYGQGEWNESVYFCNVNRNKESMWFDLKQKEDYDAFIQLVKSSDVVVENFKPGTTRKLGIDYKTLKQINDTLIYCSISGYGQTGPLQHMAGHDLNITGMGGHLQVDANSKPQFQNGLMADYAGGTMALSGILAALLDRERHGRGAYIDISMLDSLVNFLHIQSTSVFAAKYEGTAASIEGWGGNPRYNIYETKDGKYITVSLLEKKYWDQFCRLFNRTDLINPDESEADRLTTHGDRGFAYKAFMTDFFKQKLRDEWVDELQRQNIPCCPVWTVEEVLNSDIMRERGMVFEMEHRALKRKIPQINCPINFQFTDGTGLQARGE